MYDPALRAYTARVIHTFTMPTQAQITAAIANGVSFASGFSNVQLSAAGVNIYDVRIDVGASVMSDPPGAATDLKGNSSPFGCGTTTTG